MSNDRNRFRQSEFSRWQRCRRSHHFGYTLGVVPVSIGPRQPVSGQRDAGSAAHAGVEEINRGKSLPDALTAVTEYVDTLQAIRNDDELLPLTKEDDKAWWEVHRLACAITSNYVDWLAEGNESGVKFHAIEQAWEVKVPGTDFVVYGKIDAALHDPLVGGTVIRDYKSVATFAQTPEDVDFQLRTYAWAWWRSVGEVPKQAEHLMMKRVLGTGAAKPPFFERFPIPINERILVAHEAHMIARLTEMRKYRTLKADAPVLWPNPTQTCSWDCDYRVVCPMVDDGSDWEDVLEQYFVAKSDDE